MKNIRSNYNNKFSFFKSEKSKIEKITGDILVNVKRYQESCEKLYELTGSGDVWRISELLNNIVYFIVDREEIEENKRFSL